MHDGGSELEIKVRLDSLLRHGTIEVSCALGNPQKKQLLRSKCLDEVCGSPGDSLRVSSFKLSGQQVTEPPLEQGDDTSHEEEPDSPTRSPETDSRSFSDGTSVKSAKMVSEALYKTPLMP